jgi:hypothetical protein
VREKLRWVCVACLCLLAIPAQAHIVTQIFGEWKDSETWGMEVLFDAGYAIPESRDDASAPAPGRDWLLNLGESGWAPLRQEAERYLRESLEVRSGGRSESWSVDFIDFNKTPPDFPELLNEGAYFRMRVIGKNALKNPADICWKPGNRPSLVLQMPGADANYLTIAPGQSMPLPTTEGKLVGRPSWVESFQQGFLHVLPKGLDHILFIIGLFFYVRNWRNLLSQSLAFTFAHTVTLGFAAAGLIKVPGHWVEPIIALSIAVVALENLRPVNERRSWARLAIVFGFGLIHGLGFAGALSVWLKPGKGFLPSLVWANLGVELAQALILLSAWMVTLGWHGTLTYRRVRIVVCLGIAATGVTWAFQRIG